MDRLTKYQPTEGGVPYIVFNDYRTGDHWQDALQRLAAYEDTGLEPEEVKSLKETWDLFGGADGVQRVYVERDEYKQAKSEGRLIVLPCKVGDTVRYRNYVFTVMSIEILTNGEIVFRCGNSGTDDYMAFYGHELGKTVFPSREEGRGGTGR